jgi:hypothetical protein
MRTDSQTDTIIVPHKTYFFVPQMSNLSTSSIVNRGQTSQIRHPWDQTGFVPENFSNHRWSIYYGTKLPTKAMVT